MMPTEVLRLPPGLYPEVPEEAYHADCAEAPSLSASLAKLFHSHSPWHVWHGHPRLNPHWTLAPGKVRTDIGSVAHHLLFGTGKTFEVLDVEEYRSKDDRAQRDRCIAAGVVPIKRKDYEKLLPMAEACHAQVKGTEHAGVFAPGGRAEVTFIAREPSGVMLRCRTDWVPAQAMRGGHILIYDYKTTERSANPEEWQRRLWEMQFDLQAAMNERIIRQVFTLQGIEVRSVTFVFLVQEWTPPYGLSFVEVGAEGLEQAHEKVGVAIEVWQACLAAGEWPGYPRRTVAVEPALWRKSQHVARKMALFDLVQRLQEPVALPPHDPETGEITDDRPRDVFGLPALSAAEAPALPRHADPSPPLPAAETPAAMMPSQGAHAADDVIKRAVREPEAADDDIGEL